MSYGDRVGWNGSLWHRDIIIFIIAMIHGITWPTLDLFLHVGIGYSVPMWIRKTSNGRFHLASGSVRTPFVWSWEFSRLRTQARVFLRRYCWGCSQSLAWQGDNAQSGHINVFGNGQSSVPSTCSFLIASHFTPHEFFPCLFWLCWIIEGWREKRNYQDDQLGCVKKACPNPCCAISGKL